MLKLLEEFINTKRYLLELPDIWKTLMIDYEYPHVLRAYTDIGQYRYYLHLIENPEGNPPLFHKHKWPSAIYIVRGTYEMGVAYEESDRMVDKEHSLPLACKLILNKGCAYEMTQRHGLHYVKPVSKVTLSIMVTGKKYEESIKEDKGGKTLRPLTEEEFNRLMFWMDVEWPTNSIKIS